MKQTHTMMSRMRIASTLAASIIFIGVMCFLSACDKGDSGITPDPTDAGDYTLTATYDSLRSFPGGGGVFVICMQPGKDFTGSVQLRCETDPKLNASLSITKLHAADTVTEVLLRPSADVATGTYVISIVAVHAGVQKTMTLLVNVEEWSQSNFEDANQKLGQFKQWLLQRNPAYAELFEQGSWEYGTYPNILIVEHYTVITAKYELRFCYHVMIPPYDWSMIRIRRRTSPVAELAARRDTDGSIGVIPVQDYPVFAGY